MPEAELLMIYKSAAPLLALIHKSLPSTYPSLTDPNADRSMWWNAAQNDLIKRHIDRAVEMGVKIPL